MKIAIQTLGCKLNQSESASIEANLLNNKYEVVHHDERPDVCIINTCTVTAKSDYQSRQLIRKAARAGAKVIVTGCYAQLRPDEISKIEGVCSIIGNSKKSHISDVVAHLDGRSDIDVRVSRPNSPLFKQKYKSDRSRAFLKIQDGCNLSCSYCSVKIARGKSRSLPPEDVISAASDLEESGYREIVLTGVHIGSYGLDLEPSSSLSDLVDKLSIIVPDVRFRISSLEPGEITSELLSLFDRENICSHLHIPLQSGSDAILKKMRRGYTTLKYKQVINRIVTHYPLISIGTDVITGFPGETELDFEETYRFIENIPISYIHVFPYSKRPGTKAYSMDHQVSNTIKKNRVDSLIKLGARKKYFYLKRNLGRILNVIIEKKSATNEYYNAISDNYIRMQIKGSELFPGKRTNVEVLFLTSSGLVGKAFE